MMSPMHIALVSSAVVISCALAACDFPGPTAVCSCGPLPSPYGQFSGDLVGCGDLVVARQSSDSLHILHVRTLPTHMNHNRDTTYTVQLGAEASIVSFVETFATPQVLQSRVCDDIAGDDEPIAVDTITAGSVQIRAFEFSPDSVFRTFRVDVGLKEFIFNGNLVLDSLEMDSLYVGWLPG